MKFLRIILPMLTILFLGGCPSSTTNSVLGPFQAAGCDVETAFSQTSATAIVGVTGATSAPACAADLQTMFGNINFCAQQIPTPPAPAPAPTGSDAKAKVMAPKYTTIGSIPLSALHPMSPQVKFKAADAVLGVVGQFVCPLGDSAIVALFTAKIPPSCLGSTPLTASNLNQALLAGCEALFQTL